MPAALATGYEPEINPKKVASGAAKGTAPPEAAFTKIFMPLLSVANNVKVLVESFNVAAIPALVINAV